jgi:hypothetical protein
MIADPSISNTQIQRYIASNILQAAGSHASLMRTFLGESLDLGPEDLVKFADPDVTGLYIGSRTMLASIYESGSLQHTSLAKGMLSNYVMRQVDATQDKHAPDARWIRQPETKACDWCKAQVAVYASTRVFQRHDNCHCVKVRA